MSFKHLDSFKGKLDCKQITDGINCARRNSMRLVEDAQILLDAHRYASAASLAVLSIEESGKPNILRSIAIADKEDEIVKLWKNYRSHTKKNVLWLMPKLAEEGAQVLDDFKSLFDSKAEHPFILENIKQIGFYTDCLGKSHWSEPSTVIDKDFPTTLVNIAKIFAKDTQISVKEIELWVKHMGAAKKSSYQEQKLALLNWYAEMLEFELLPKDFDLTDVIRWLGLKEDNLRIL